MYLQLGVSLLSHSVSIDLLGSNITYRFCMTQSLDLSSPFVKMRFSTDKIRCSPSGLVCSEILPEKFLDPSPQYLYGQLNHSFSIRNTIMNHPIRSSVEVKHLSSLYLINRHYLPWFMELTFYSLYLIITVYPLLLQNFNFSGLLLRWIKAVQKVNSLQS